MLSRTYRVGRSRISVRFGDITASDAEVLVSSDDYKLSMGGGVSAAILLAGGSTIADDAAKRIPLSLGDVVVTTAGQLPARHVFHAVTIGPGDDELSPDVVVRQVCRKAMRLLSSLGCRSIAFPAIGTGVARIPCRVAASQTATVLVSELLGAGRVLKSHVCARFTEVQDLVAQAERVLSDLCDRRSPDAMRM